MKYIVMESHYSYAILLDENGRFVKAANLHYEEGQTVTDIIEMNEVPVRKINKRLNTILAVAIACVVFMITSYINHQTYASVFMVINPEVRIDVNRKNIVVGLKGINADGVLLVRDYSYQKKSLEPVMDELVDRAIAMGYLTDGKQVTLTLDAKDNRWIADTETELQTHINEYVADKITIEIDIISPKETSAPVSLEDGESPYGESDYGNITTKQPVEENIVVDDIPESTPAAIHNPETFDHGNSGYDHDDGADDGSSSYAVSSYDDTDYGPNNDGVTDYVDDEDDD